MIKSFTHGFQTLVALPHMKNYNPRPNTPPLEVAFWRGKEARRKGRGAHENPHDEATLAAEWDRGYNDTGKR